MANVIQQSTLEAFQAYVLEHGTDFWARLQYGFKTAALADSVEGVKGKFTLPTMTIGSNLSKRWTSTYEGQANKATPGQRVLETFLNKIEFSFIPTEWESTYLGFLRRSGQDPYDFPLAAYVIMKIIEKHNKEREDAVWQAVQADPAADSDLLSETFDGFLQIIADAITATTITPVTTGAISSTNAVEKFRDMWETVDKAYKEAQNMAILCNHTIYDYYRIDHKTRYYSAPQVEPVTDTDYTGMVYEMGGGNVRIIPIAGLGSSNRVIMTPLDNLVIGYDGDPADLNTELNHWAMDMFAAFRMGVQFKTLDSGILVVNDQT